MNVDQQIVHQLETVSQLLDNYAIEVLTALHAIKTGAPYASFFEMHAFNSSSDEQKAAVLQRLQQLTGILEHSVLGVPFHRPDQAKTLLFNDFASKLPVQTVFEFVRPSTSSASSSSS